VLPTKSTANPTNVTRSWRDHISVDPLRSWPLWLIHIDTFISQTLKNGYLMGRAQQITFFSLVEGREVVCHTLTDVVVVIVVNVKTINETAIVGTEVNNHAKRKYVSNNTFDQPIIILSRETYHLFTSGSLCGPISAFWP
jgi:hypothetical protein